MTAESEEPLILVARAVRARGLKGEIVADLLTDFPERFAAIKQFVCLDQTGRKSVITLEDYWFQQGRVILKLAGVNDVDTASEFSGCEFGLPESERVQLPAGEFYDWELEGCLVSTIDGEQLGQVREIMRTGGVDTLVIAGTKVEDYLVPLAEPIIISVDTTAKAIVIDPPEGLLDL